jgi:superfamily I DNA and RNA helicase
MTYKELYEAIKPFATDKVYQDDIVVVIDNGRKQGIFADLRPSMFRVIAVTDDGEIEVG